MAEATIRKSFVGQVYLLCGDGVDNNRMVILEELKRLLLIPGLPLGFFIGVFLKYNKLWRISLFF